MLLAYPQSHFLEEHSTLTSIAKIIKNVDLDINTTPVLSQALSWLTTFE